jgi:shikimate kinase
MQPKRNIVLVGFMGTGKTTAGRLLAEKLHMRFVDMDDMIVEREGKPVARIFAEDGEPHFRRAERRIVVELAGQSGWVVGAGGGVVTNPRNIRDFSRTGHVVCLWAEPETILSRVKHDDQRPLLAGGDKLRKITELLEKRRPLYEAIPLRVRTDALTLSEVVEEVLRRISGAPVDGWQQIR